MAWLFSVFKKLYENSVKNLFSDRFFAKIFFKVPAIAAILLFSFFITGINGSGPKNS